MKLKIIVVGVTHHNTLGMVRCVGNAGYNVDLLIMTDGKKKSFVSRSRYVKRVIAINCAGELTHELLGIKRLSDTQHVIIPCTDGAAHELDMNYDVLKDHFIFFNAGESGRITHFMNKQIQIEIANKAGLTVPWSKEYSEINGDVSYPCLLKPVQSINGGKKIIICKNKAEFEEAIKRFDDQVDILVQRYVTKEEEIVVLGVSTKNGISIPGYILKHREHDGGTTYSTVCDSYNLPSDVVDRCRNLVMSIHYTGLFGIEFLISSGKYFFIEINLRNDATTYGLAVAGANLAKTYIESVVGHSLINQPVGRIEQIESIVEFNDFKHRKENGLSANQWLKQYLRAKCKYYFNAKDMLPFFFAPFK